MLCIFDEYLTTFLSDFERKLGLNVNVIMHLNTFSKIFLFKALTSIRGDIQELHLNWLPIDRLNQPDTVSPVWSQRDRED